MLKGVRGSREGGREKRPTLFTQGISLKDRNGQSLNESRFVEQ